jgi:hypothetical protein
MSREFYHLVELPVEEACRQKWVAGRKLYGGDGFVGHPGEEAFSEGIDLLNYLTEWERQGEDVEDIRQMAGVVTRLIQRRLLAERHLGSGRPAGRGRLEMSRVKERVERLMAVVPLEPEPAELLRTALAEELQTLAVRQANFEAESADRYAGEQLWRGEASQLRQAMVDLLGYVECLLAKRAFNRAAEELPEHIAKAMDSLFPPSRKET